MLRHLFRFLVRQRFRVYRFWPLRKKLRMAHNALTMHPRSLARRLEPALADVDRSNGVLQRRDACVQAEDVLLDVGLVPHYSRTKSWDFLKALALLVDEVPRDAPVLDMGCGAFSVILEWLEAAGYQDLHGCDYFVERAGRVGGIQYSRQDLTATSYPDHAFSAVTCMSVIEHNVDLPAFLQEVRRVLRPGGLLVVSTDYWPDKIDTAGVRPYGDDVGDTRIFDEAELRAFVEQAAAAGFDPLTPMRYEAAERAVRWPKIPEPYTFAFVAFRRRAP